MAKEDLCICCQETNSYILIIVVCEAKYKLAAHFPRYWLMMIVLAAALNLTIGVLAISWPL